MKTTTAALGFVAAVAAYPAASRLDPRACTPGVLICNGASQFGLCNSNGAIAWINVADGTSCLCHGSECHIIAVSGSTESVAVSTAASATAVATTAGLAPAPAAPSADGAPVSDTPDALSASAPVATGTASPPSKSSDFVNNLEVAAAVADTPESPATSAPVPAASSASPSPSPSKSPSKSNPGSGSGSGSGSTAGSTAGKAYIKTFLGTGAPSQGWPEQSQWVDFESMWSANLANVISKACSSFGQPNNSDQESADLKKAILSVAKSSNIDARFILAVVTQESGGCVRAPTTNYGVRNPGLMQSHDGAHSCYNVNPCPSAQILGMVQDGSAGTSSGDGLQQILAKAGSGVAQYYKASRVYNSGSVAASGLLQDGIATHCYASDIANRLIGWSEGLSGCKI
ncbi:uncharacterized protein UV8b_05259 [Ustilaginoidea virens]|uniref:Glycoside hydrolase n=1 Tax=Ustilaginoidea virens TaxID=1159556 RepID=A0A8E5MHX8_USTVR|nr:uncharacterized protein UV8b_05259 [Ustilaginoidea virens]QUC21018.1 hypothetical protein UV8b_05259 [Ustilaginoidea virens]